MRRLADDLNVCSKQGMAERFDCNIGAGTVLMPYGGIYQRTPIQAMAHKISREKGDALTCSLMSWGFNPHVSEKSPFHGAYLAVVESVSKLVASGAGLADTYLSFQEYFEKLGHEPSRWGKPLAALLGAYKAQKELRLASIGGKDSMSGSFEDIHVPPTLISFAVTVEQVAHVVSPEFKQAGHRVVLLRPETDADGLPTADSLLKNFETVAKLLHSGCACAAYTPGFGGVAEAVMKMGFGNNLGLAFDKGVSLKDLFSYAYGAFVLELADETVQAGLPLGVVTQQPALTFGARRWSSPSCCASRRPSWPPSSREAWTWSSRRCRPSPLRAPQSALPPCSPKSPGSSSRSFPAPTANTTRPRPWSWRGARPTSSSSAT